MSSTPQQPPPSAQGSLEIVDVEPRTPEQQDEAVAAAYTYAQERIATFLAEVESQAENHKSIKISYITSRKTSIDVLATNPTPNLNPNPSTGTGTGNDNKKNNDKDEHAKNVKSLVEKLVNGSTKEALGGSASGEHVYSKLMSGGEKTGSVQVERNYSVAPNPDPPGGLIRLDTLFFCNRSVASGLTVLGACVVKSVGVAVDADGNGNALSAGGSERKRAGAGVVSLGGDWKGSEKENEK